MNKQQKCWLLVGPVVISFIFALTSPVIQIYFMRLVSPEVLTVANMITVGLAAVTNTTVTKDSFMTFYRNHFAAIVFIDVVCFCVVSFLGVEWAALRFIGFAILNAISTTLWFVVVDNAVNRKIDGDQLTVWHSYSKSWSLYASLAGGALLLLCSDMAIEVALALQCGANLVMGITDIKAISELKKDNTNDEKNLSGANISKD